MNINWKPTVPGPYGLDIPTYGNYGGPGYSGGHVLEYPTQPVDYTTPPVDALDALFRTHDQAYDSLDPLTRAEGDLALVQGISDLPRGTLDPEESLYGGLAILFGLEQMTTVNDQPQLISPHEALAYTREALFLVERGLAKASPEDIAGIDAWLQDATGVAAGDGAQNGLDQAVALLHEAEIQGNQAWIGATHLAGPRLDKALFDAAHDLFGTGAAATGTGSVDPVLNEAAHIPHHWGFADAASDTVEQIAPHLSAPHLPAPHLSAPEAPAIPDRLAELTNTVPQRAEEALSAVLDGHLPHHGWALWA